MKIKQILLLLSILALAASLRLYHLDANPLILNRDEAALAFNAYSLAFSSNGIDEWQERYPVIFKSFGDYKLPGYIYLLVGIFTLTNIANDWLVRLPAAVAGIVIVYLAFLIAKKTLPSIQAALLAALTTAVLPTTIFYSRMAWEANLGLMWSLWSIYLLFFSQPTSNKQRQLHDYLAVIVTLLAVFTYNSPLLYLPVLIILLVLYRGIKQWRDWLPVSLGLLSVLVIAAMSLFSLTAQKSGITILTDPTVWHQYTQYRQELPGLLLQLVGSRYVYYFGLVVNNLFNSFTPRYLVTQGGAHPWHSVPGYGHIYWVVYLFGLLGIILTAFQSLIQIKHRNIKPITKDQLLLLSLFITSLLPAVITVDAPHATRSLLFFVFWPILTISALFQVAKKFSFPQLVLLVFITLLSLEASQFFYANFLKYPHQQEALKPGYDQVVREIYARFPDKQVAVVADGYQYILTAWYLKPDANTLEGAITRSEPDTIGLYYGERYKQFRFINHLEQVDEADELVTYWDADEYAWQVISN